MSRLDALVWLVDRLHSAWIFVSVNWRDYATQCRVSEFDYVGTMDLQITMTHHWLEHAPL